MSLHVAEPNGSLCLVIIDHTGWRAGSFLDEDSALTLFAVASEDPENWQEIAAYWPRYRTPHVAEFADGLPLTPVDEQAARLALTATDYWLVIDLVRKRISSGKDFDEVGRDQVFAMSPDDGSDQSWPLSIHLPPWWELQEQTTPEAVDEPRASPLDRPRPDREVLFGTPMIETLGRRVIEVATSERWRATEADSEAEDRYPFTVEVHREWLMTARDDLGGRTPREMLHGAIDWIDRVTRGQRIRFEDGESIVAAPTDVLGFEEAPMGREEICMYFDLCREIIEAGWFWLCEAGDPIDECELPHLCDYLQEVKNQWLVDPFEGGSPPRFIIECSRRRVPRGRDVEIVGMTERETDDHVVDCNCPVCEMIAEGVFGVGFTAIDGFHLSIDREFAFSLCETAEEWEQEQRRSEELLEDIGGEHDEDDSLPVCGDVPGDATEFSSVWAGRISNEPIPGDDRNHLMLAFMLTDIVATLELSDAPRTELRELNSRFREFRTGKGMEQQRQSASNLKDYLDQVAASYPQLVPRISDFQSRIDESIRDATDSSDEVRRGRA